MEIHASAGCLASLYACCSFALPLVCPAISIYLDHICKGDAKIGFCCSAVSSLSAGYCLPTASLTNGPTENGGPHANGHIDGPGLCGAEPGTARRVSVELGARAAAELAGADGVASRDDTAHNGSGAGKVHHFAVLS